LLSGFRDFTNEEVTFNKYQSNRKRVKDFIKNRDEVCKSKLLQGLKMSSNDLQTILVTLIDEDTIRMRKVKSANHKMTEFYSING